QELLHGIVAIEVAVVDIAPQLDFLAVQPADLLPVHGEAVPADRRRRAIVAHARATGCQRQGAQQKEWNEAVLVRLHGVRTHVNSYVSCAAVGISPTAVPALK